MKTKLLFLFLLLFVGVTFTFGQNYPNIVNYNFNATHTYGIKIKTNLPFVNSSQMPVVKIEGYNYTANSSYSATIDLNIAWYIFDNAFYASTASSFGGTAPNIWLSNEGGKVVIFLDQKIYYQRFTVSAFAQGLGEKPEYFQGWTVSDAALAGTQQKQVPYKNVFAGKVGIGTETPECSLDVNGDIRGNSLYLKRTEIQNNWGTSRIYYPGHSLIIGSPEGSYGHNVLEIKPGGASQGLLWSTLGMYIASNIGVQQKKVFIQTAGASFFNGGDVGIGTENPQAKLDVRGVISATEVKVQVLSGMDFVFSKDYELKPLSEVEAFVKENKHLPEIPSEKQMQENGLGMSEFQIKLLQKIEELTLYTINQEKRLNEQQSLIEKQNKRIEQLEKK